MKSARMLALQQGALPLVARILLCAIFIPAVIGKTFDWAGNVRYMASHGMPLVTPLLLAALAVEALGSLCVIIGWHARLAALVMAGYLVPVTVVFHNFWTHPGVQQTQFLKNAGIIGGLLMLAAFGPGTLSLDARRARATA
jgi:putative oxidoreductase